MKIKKLVLLSFVLAFSGILLAAEKISFGLLTCDFRENPIAVDNNHPVFGWKLQSNSDNVYQKAYEIIVGDCIDEIKNLKGNNWSRTRWCFTVRMYW